MGPGGTSNFGTVLVYGRGNAVKVEPLLYPSNTVLLSLCGPGDIAASPLGSGIFTIVSWLGIVASWSSYDWD